MKQYITCSLVACLMLASAAGYAQTNDPLLNKQQYLFDFHNMDQAWNLTTGSSNVRIGIYSMLGFRQLHEDLNGARILTSVGSLLQPEFDYASEVTGIIGATKNNSVGMAGIDQQAMLQSFSVLRAVQAGDIEDNIIEFENDGTTHRYYLDINEFTNRVNTARNAGVDVHVFSFGLPTGKEVDYTGSSIPSFNVPTPRFTLPLTPVGQLFWLLNQRGPEIIGSLCVSNCWTPPPPIENFRVAVGNLVMFDEQVSIAPVGDLEDVNDPPEAYMPAMMNRYVTGVGGVVEDGFGNFSKWPRSIEAPYVDVVAAAENVVGLSGTGFSAYNEEFGGTAAAAAITAGTAALMKAEDSDLSSEDVREILSRTAISVGGAGHNNATGYGVVDAGAAVSYVRNNDILRLTAQSSDVTVLSDNLVSGMSNVVLEGYQQYSPQIGCQLARGDLRKFEARIAFSQFSTSTVPDVWVRWAQSDGIDISVNPVTGKNHYDPFEKSLTVTSVDQNGFNIEGYYWLSTWRTHNQQDCWPKVEIPTSPANFQIAYTVSGDLYQSLLTVALTGSSYLNQGELGSWTATASDGSGSTWNFKWYTCPGGFSCTLQRDVNKTVNTDAFSYAWHTTGTNLVQVTVTRGGESASAGMLVAVTGCDPSGMCWSVGEPGLEGVMEAVPDRYVLEGNYPNPFNPTTEIRFGLPEAAAVTLVVYDVRGREVARLVDGMLEAGFHRATWDAANLPSGIYLYRLTAGNFTETRRMGLVR